MSNRPPPTHNDEARVLISAAQAACNGCRTNWRLKVGTFLHPVPGGTVQCWAPEHRQALREIARRNKDDAILRRQVTAIDGDM